MYYYITYIFGYKIDILYIFISNKGSIINTYKLNRYIFIKFKPFFNSINNFHYTLNCWNSQYIITIGLKIFYSIIWKIYIYVDEIIPEY